MTRLPAFLCALVLGLALSEVQAAEPSVGAIVGNEGGLWYPDLRTREVVWGAGVMVKF